ncbi:MAG TPA: thioredoxin family protein [Streptosporangiaceae bacterium]
MTAGLAVCVAALVAATAIGLAWKRGNGRMRGTTVPAAGPGEQAGPPRVTAVTIGEPLGERATLVQFSSAFCAPCRATRRILAEVAGQVDGVTHVEIDAESRLDLVRALGILRTPTVLVLDSGGTVVRRASGQPRKADVIAAVGVAAGMSGVSDPGATVAPTNSYSSDQESR